MLSDQGKDAKFYVDEVKLVRVGFLTHRYRYPFYTPLRG